MYEKQWTPIFLTSQRKSHKDVYMRIQIYALIVSNKFNIRNIILRKLSPVYIFAKGMRQILMETLSLGGIVIMPWGGFKPLTACQAEHFLHFSPGIPYVVMVATCMPLDYCPRIVTLLCNPMGNWWLLAKALTALVDKQARVIPFLRCGLRHLGRDKKLATSLSMGQATLGPLAKSWV